MKPNLQASDRTALPDFQAHTPPAERRYPALLRYPLLLKLSLSITSPRADFQNAVAGKNHTKMRDRFFGIGGAMSKGKEQIVDFGLF